MMSRLHYILLARILMADLTIKRLALESDADEVALIRALCLALRNNNPRFDPTRFKRACGIL